MKPINVGLLGIGTVGGGTYTVLKRNAEEIARRAGRPIQIVAVADKDLELARKVTGEACRLSDDAFSIVSDPEVDVVVELIGGYGVAKDLVLKAIENGKHVVTANKALATAVADLQSQMSSNATTFAQWGALAVYTQPDKAKASLAEMSVAFDRRRKALHAKLNEIPGLSCFRSQAAFYLFPNIKSFGIPSQEFASRLLDEENVAVVPGSAFGAEGYIRLSYATSDETIAKGVERIARFCAKLRAEKKA